MVILDTCALIELGLLKPALSLPTLKLIEAEAILLSVSFAEIALKIKQKKLILNLSAREFYRHYAEIPSLSILKIGCEEWFEAIDLEWNHKDPADRLIVAYARKTGSPIVTTDKQIKQFYKNTIW